MRIRLSSRALLNLAQRKGRTVLLRRITQHVKEQNWFAVFLDFVIVVFGVFIGFQVNNWNNLRQDKIREVVILEQLSDEFRDIKSQLEEEKRIAKLRLDATKHVVALIDTETEKHDTETKLALIRNMGLGRVPSTSATYRQLVSNGELPLIQNDDLRRALIRYHDTIEKNEILFERTLESVSEFLSSNSAIIVDVNAEGFSDTNADTVTDIDWAGVRQRRPYFVNTFIFNNLFFAFYSQELNNAEDIINLIETSKGR